MILMIDNYDSFTYNLVQYLSMLNEQVEVRRNDEISIEQIKELKPQLIVVSPGPGRPENAGIIIELIKEFSGNIPILGICLGHQAIVSAFGGKIVHAGRIMHGKVSEIKHDGKGIFQNIPSPLRAVRYHSLAAERASLPECFEISAESEDGEIMGIRHREYTLVGMQYHPESIMTSSGKRQLANFLTLAKEKQQNDQ